MTDDPTEGTSEKFRGKIDGCERLLTYAEGLLGDWPGRAVENVPDGLILALFARSFDTATAAVRLAADGYGAQASMLNRSLFEDMIDIHWVATEEEAAERCYADHLKHGQMLLADAVAKYPDLYPEIDLPEFDADERLALDRKYGRFGHKSWTEINLHDLVSAVEHPGQTRSAAAPCTSSMTSPTAKTTRLSTSPRRTLERTSSSTTARSG
jgi:hypothetical protein